MASQAPPQAEAGGDQWIVIPDWHTFEPGDELEPETEWGACLLDAAAEDVKLAWAMVFFEDPPFDDEVQAKAVENLLAGGAEGIPWTCVMWFTDPREALAAALGEDDPHAAPLLASAARTRASGEPVHEFDGTVYSTSAEALKVMERRIRRTRARSRRRPATNRQPHSRRRRDRRRTRAPPSGDSDDDPDLDPPGEAVS